MSNPLLTLLIVAAIFGPFVLRFLYDHFFGPVRAPQPARGPTSPPQRQPPRRGLDAAVLATFPTVKYGDVRGLKYGDGELACAICIEEFSNEDELRLLPHCSHVFHVGCIDEWLGSKRTCPVCRQDLSEPVPTEMATPETRRASPEEVVPARSPAVVGHWRCHSTGHEGEAAADRYTLRLPEKVWREILAAGEHRRAASMTAVPVEGEAGRRRRRWSGRWGSFFRTVSEHWRSEGKRTPPPAGEVATEGRRRGATRRWHSSVSFAEEAPPTSDVAARRGRSGGWSGQWGSFLGRWRTAEEVGETSAAAAAGGESSGEGKGGERGEELV